MKPIVWFFLNFRRISGTFFHPYLHQTGQITLYSPKTCNWLCLNGLLRFVDMKLCALKAQKCQIHRRVKKLNSNFQPEPKITTHVDKMMTEKTLQAPATILCPSDVTGSVGPRCMKMEMTFQRLPERSDQLAARLTRKPATVYSSARLMIANHRFLWKGRRN